MNYLKAFEDYKRLFHDLISNIPISISSLIVATQKHIMKSVKSPNFVFITRLIYGYFYVLVKFLQELVFIPTLKESKMGKIYDQIQGSLEIKYRA